MAEIAESKYQVKTSVFEGPLDVLLRFIEERKLFINEISLSEVTEAYLSHVRSLQEYNFSGIASFLVVAATLILIKSRSLLPGLMVTDEEKGEIQDLEKRLRLYQFDKEAAAEVKKNFGKNIIHFGPGRMGDISVFAPDAAITLENLQKLCQEAIGNIPSKVFMPEVKVSKVVSIEEMMESLAERIQNSLKMSFKEFSLLSGSKDVKEKKVYLIVSFIAMLEMVRTGLMDAIQNENFGDINMEKRSGESLTETLAP